MVERGGMVARDKVVRGGWHVLFHRLTKAAGVDDELLVLAGGCVLEV